MPALCSIFSQEDAITQLQNVQLELGTTHEDLQALVSNTVEHSDDEIRYVFYINDIIIQKTLGEAIFAQNLTLENIIKITAVPQEKINVSALSRCGANLPGHEDSVLCVQFAPDSRYIASGSGDKTVRIWDCQTGTCKTILQHKAWVLALKYSPDGSRLVAADYEGAITVWNCENYSKLFQTQGQKGRTWVTCVQWDWAGERFFTGAKDGVIRCYNKDGQFVKQIGNHQKCVTALTCSARFLVSSSEDCTVNVYDVENKYTFIKALKHAHWVNSVHSSCWFLARYGVLGLLRLFQLYKGQLDQLGVRSAEQLSSMDAAQQRSILHSMLLQQKELLVTASDDHTMCLYTLYPNIQLVQQMTGHTRQINQAVFSPSGQFVASCAFDRTVRVWNWQGKFLMKFQCHASEVYQVVFSADSRLILSGGKDSTCKVYSLKQQKMIRELPGHDDEVYCVDWSLSGEYGASGGKDKMVKLWRQ